MGAVSLSGSLTIGPTGATAVPAGVNSVPVATTPDPKTCSVSANGVKLLASPSAFQTLAGLGAGSDVTGASFLYLKTTSPVDVRLTFASSRTATFPVQGTFIGEFPATELLALVELQGTSTVEYIVTGDQ